MSSLTRSETARWLTDRDRFVILTHCRPDGDTVGTAAALCLGLRQLGKTAHVLHNREVTLKYAPLLAGLTKAWPQEGDVLVAVDTAAVQRLPEDFLPLAEKIALRIDHHGTRESFTAFELVEPEAAACGEILWGLLELMGISLDKPMAEALYTAVATDTGCFRFPNTTPASFRTAAACAEAGGDLAAINREIFDTNSFRKLKIQSWITENTRFLAGGQIAVCAIPLEVERRIGVTEDDMDGISGFPRSIEGVKIAATLREIGGGRVKVSVRALPGYDADRVCAHFGGGGHKGAAGCTISMPLAEAAKAVAEAMPEM
ncbi:MAG: DHH family phosphoesterase [Oscillospiraceae bacterium]|nr:DHH family phosphoesterase [Oscillospiraceae bacterium]